MQDNESQKKDQYHIWRLIGQKLAGKASKNELLELQELLRDNPHVQYSMEILTGLSEPGKGPSDKGNENPLNLPRDPVNPQQGRGYMSRPF